MIPSAVLISSSLVPHRHLHCMCYQGAKPARPDHSLHLCWRACTVWTHPTGSSNLMQSMPSMLHSVGLPAAACRRRKPMHTSHIPQATRCTPGAFCRASYLSFPVVLYRMCNFTFSVPTHLLPLLQARWFDLHARSLSLSCPRGLK